MRRALLSVVVLLVLPGCDTSGDSGEGVAVTATTTQVGDLVGNVGGDRVRLTTILRPGADPHEFEPRPSDARSIADSRLVFRSGGDVDAWLGELIKSAGGGGRVIELMDSVRALDRDPHWWQDPRNAELAVAAIRDALVEADPGAARLYRRRAAAYERRLRRLDRGIARCLDEVPPARRKIVTTHDSLGYFARRYGLEVVGAVIPSRSTQAQPSGRDIQRLVEQIRKEGVEAIFPESSLNPRLERALASEAGVAVGDALWADSLGKPGSDGASYLAAMASQTEAMVRGMSRGTSRCRPGTRP